eukprot:sb/3471143/
MGDFNFPMIDWNNLSIGGRSAENTRSARDLLEFSENYFLQQIVDSPTRGHNILDLFLVNKVSLVGKVQVVGTELSDHDLVHVGLTFHPSRPQQRHRAKLEGFRALDWHNGDYDLLRERLAERNWEKEVSLLLKVSKGPLFTQEILSVCQEVFPEVKAPRGKPNCYQKLQRKKIKLRARVEALRSKDLYK